MAALVAVGRVPHLATATTPRPVHAQPTWPFHWAGAAQDLAAAGDFSPRFDQALAKAIRLGPAERKLRLQLAVLGLWHWDRLSARARELTDANIDATMLTQPGTLLRSAFAIRREHLACARVREAPELTAVCQRFADLRGICDRPRPSVDLAVWCLERYATPRYPPRFDP